MRAWFAYEGGVLWLRTETRGGRKLPDWYRNLRRDPDCRVRVGGHEVAARYEAVEDRAAALSRVVTLWRAKYGQEWVADWWMDLGREPVTVRLVR